MNARSYIRLLRPVRGIFFVTIYTFCGGWSAAKMLAGVDETTSLFLALILAFPLLLGVVLASPMHEASHHPFFLLLPNAACVMRRWAAASVVMVAALATIALHFIAPGTSSAANFGVFIALLALPQTDRHQAASGFGWTITLLLLWLAFNFWFGALLPGWMRAAPGYFLVGGVLVATLSFRLAFSKTTLREVAFAPLVSLYAGSTNQYVKTRLVQQQVEMKLRNTRKVSTGQNWKPSARAGSIRGWMEAIRHESDGRIKHAALRNLFVLMVGMCFALLTEVFIFSFLDRIPHRPSVSVAEQFTWLTLLPIQLNHGGAAAMIPFLGMMIQLSVGVIVAITVPRPLLSYPISRDALAEAVFRLTRGRFILGATLPLIVIFLFSAAGQLVSGRVQPGWGAFPLLVASLVQGALLPLAVATSLGCNRPWKRITWGLVAFSILMPITFTRSFWFPYFSQPFGFVLLILCALGTTWIFKATLKRQYRHADLRNVGDDLLSKMGNLMSA